MQKLHLVTTVPRYKHWIAGDGHTESSHDHDESREFDVVLKGHTITVPVCKLNPSEFEIIPYTFKIHDFDEGGYIDTSGHKSTILTWYGTKHAMSWDKIETEKIAFQAWAGNGEIFVDVEYIERPYPGARYFHAESSSIKTSSFTLDQVKAFMPKLVVQPQII